MPDPLIKNARTHFDLTDPEHQESVLRLAEAFLDQEESAEQLRLEAASPDAPQYSNTFEARKVRPSTSFSRSGESRRATVAVSSPTGTEPRRSGVASSSPAFE